jgi:hypothetical protein
VQQGSYNADHVFSGEAFLDNDMGRDMLGHIRRIAIAHQLTLACDRGDLPWKAVMKPMPKGRWHWLEVTGVGALAHACRTEEVFAFPAEADSRQDVRLALQPDLFTAAEKRSLAEVLRDVPQIYTWLTFRVGQDGLVSHLCWASPASDRDEWLGHINVLDQIRRSGTEPAPISPVPDPKDRLRLKDHIAAALQKSPAKKSS